MFATSHFIFFRSLLFFFSTTVVSLYSITLLLNVIFHSAQPADISTSSNCLMALDRHVYGVYPGLEMIKTLSGTYFEDAILIAYLNLFPVLSLVLLAAFFLKREVFRKVLILFFLTLFVSWPLWVIMPAISPNEMYRLNILSVKTPPEIQSEISKLGMSQKLSSALVFLENKYVDKNRKFYSVSTNPSMHAAWGVIILYAAISIWRPLAFVFGPWFVLNAIGTIYTLEHYSIDTYLGILIGVFAIWLVNYLVKIEKKYFADRFKLVSNYSYTLKNIPMFMKK